MKRALDEKEIAVLNSLREAGEPLGSWNLVDKLEKRGLNVSSATIGRTLSGLEHAGFVEKSGNNGRLITEAGLIALSNNKVSRAIKKHTETLEAMITTHTLDDYLLVLQARRAIERETARLAAQNVTDDELDAMEKMLAEQEQKHADNRSIAETDIGFHRAIARASRNKVLESLYVMLFSYGQQTTIFEHIRKQVDAVYMTSHLDILKALRTHDPDKAEACMVAHMESLIEDVCKFWDMFYR